MQIAFPEFELNDVNNSLLASQTPLWHTAHETVHSIHENMFLVKTERGMKMKSLKFGTKQIVYSHNKTINFTDAHLKFIFGSQQQIVGFLLQKKGDSIQIMGDINPILETLKQQTIQTDFQDKYRMQTLIGKGNFSDVYQVIAYDSGVEMSAKIYDKNKLKREKERQAMLNEIHYLRTIKHDQIIHLTEVFENKRFIYVITPLCKGGDLKSFVQQQALNEVQCSNIMNNLFKGINHLHSHQIFHRDLKPQNILFKRKNDISSVCIIDLGLLEEYNEFGIYNCTQCGTSGFMAPEVLRGEQYEMKVDVFSLGLILYYMLTGKKPFFGLTKKEIEAKNLQGIVNLTINCSESCMDFLKNSLEIDPKKRFSAFQALQHQFLQTGPGKLIFKKPVLPPQPQPQNLRLNLHKLKRLKTLELQEPSVQPVQPMSNRISQSRQFLIRKKNIF